MRPHLISFALTSTALIISGCSSARSLSTPLGGSGGVASSASDFNEYDRDPPASRQSPRMAAEPAPVPPARGISFSRIIDATPAGFRRAIGCGDSCSGDACGTDGCTTNTNPVRTKKRCLLGFHLLKNKNLGCFQKLCSHGCTDGEACTEEAACVDANSCTDQACNTCAAPSTYCPPQEPQVPACDQENRPRIAPPLGEPQPQYVAPQKPGYSPEPANDGSDDAQKVPGMVPDIPVDPIGQSRDIQPPKWNTEPLFKNVQDIGQSGQRVIRLEPPVWRDGTRSRSDLARTQNLLTPSASPLKSPAFSDDGRAIQIQPLIRAAESESANTL